MSRLAVMPTNDNTAHVDAMHWLGGIWQRKAELRRSLRNLQAPFDVTLPGYMPEGQTYRVLAGSRQEAIDTAFAHHGVSHAMRRHTDAVAVEAA